MIYHALKESLYQTWKIENEKNEEIAALAHDYILSDDMERIFEASREEIQPLLKLCGCKCFLNKKRSIWIKAGTKEERIREILKNNKFKYK